MSPMSRTWISRAIPVPLIWLVLAFVASGARAADGGDGGSADAAGPGCGAVTIKGCCKGQILFFCAAAVLKSLDCSNTPQCGWRADFNYYACGTTGAADPSGKTPRACPAASADAGVDAPPPPAPDLGATDAPATDGSVLSDASGDAVVWRPPDAAVDLGAGDRGADKGPSFEGGDPGCGCRASGGLGGTALPLVVLVLLLGFRRQGQSV